MTLFQGDGIQGVADQRSRTPEELTRSLAMALAAVNHPQTGAKTLGNAILILCPEHYLIFRDAGLGPRPHHQRVARRASPSRPGPGCRSARCGEGIAASRAEDGAKVLERWNGLLIVRAGGRAGNVSAICAGWLAARERTQTQPVTKEIQL